MRVGINEIQIGRAFITLGREDNLQHIVKVCMALLFVRESIAKAPLWPQNDINIMLFLTLNDLGIVFMVRLSREQKPKKLCTFEGLLLSR